MTPNPADLLDQARAAFSRMAKAESEVARLNSYRSLSHDMRGDLMRWTSAKAQARAELCQALAVQP